MSKILKFITTANHFTIYQLLLCLQKFFLKFNNSGYSVFRENNNYGKSFRALITRFTKSEPPLAKLSVGLCAL